MGNGRAGARIGLIAALGWLAIAGAATASETCTEEAVTVTGDFGKARFAVDVADDVEERARGLMFVESLPTMAGMLFVYEREQLTSFWMENTLIPLDMIFADAEGIVTKVHANAVPLDRTGIPSGGPVRFVLEINGGMAERLGIDAGDRLIHPAIGCE